MERRNFIKSLIAPVVAIPITIKGVEGNHYQTPEGRYVFHFPNISSQEHLNEFTKYLRTKGFKDPVVVGGAESEGFQLYKVSF